MISTVEELVTSPYVQAISITIVSVLLAWSANWAVSKVFTRWTKRTATELDDQLLALAQQPIFITVLVVGLSLATNRLRLPPGVAWLTLGVLKTIAVLVWMVFGFRLANLFRDHFGAADEEGSPVPLRLLPLFNNLVKVVVAGAAAYFFFLTWSINVSAWLASAGIIGIALGFAAKDTLANLFAGVFILADAPYKVGDFVILGAGERGRVTSIGIRSTRVLTRDDIEITIPNAVIGNAKIINESGGPYEKHRVRIKVQVAYGTDVDKLREVMLAIAREHPEVCPMPTPRVRFRSFGESGLDFELLVWVPEPVMRGRVVDALNTRVYKRLAEERIEIPYPVRDVRVRRVDEPSL